PWSGACDGHAAMCTFILRVASGICKSVSEPMTDQHDNEGTTMEQVLPVRDSIPILPASTTGCPDCEQAEQRTAADMPVMARLRAAEAARLAYRLQRI